MVGIPARQWGRELGLAGGRQEEVGRGRVGQGVDQAQECERERDRARERERERSTGLGSLKDCLQIDHLRKLLLAIALRNSIQGNFQWWLLSSGVPFLVRPLSFHF